MPTPGKAVARDINVYVEGWDSVLSNYIFDVVVNVPKMNSIWRFSEQSHEPLELAVTGGRVPCHDVPLLDGGFIVVECTDNATGRLYMPSSSTDPYNQNPLEWKLSAQTLPGSMASTTAITHALTNPQWNATGSLTFKESGKILGFGVEATEGAQVTRQGRITTNTLQQQQTITTPQLTVYGCELHRTNGRPDLSMNSSQRTARFA